MQRGLGQIGDAGLGPGGIGQGLGADFQRRAADRPGAGAFGHPRQRGGRADGKAQPQPGQAPELAEAAQHRDIRRTGGGDRQVGAWIGKAFIHQQMADRRRDGRDLRRGKAAPVGVVRVHDDGQIGAGQRFGIERLGHLPARRPQAGGMFVIGRRQHRRRPAGNDMRQKLDRGRGPGQRQDPVLWCAVDRGGGPDQPVLVGGGRQRRQSMGRQRGRGIGPAVDPGREVDPCRTAEMPRRPVDIAAVIAHALPPPLPAFEQGNGAPVKRMQPQQKICG